MSTEVKLLTLLNVSAIKRPRDSDLPGGFRSPSLSRAVSAALESEDERDAKRGKHGKHGKHGKAHHTHSNGTKNEVNGDASASDSASTPARRRSVAWGGVVGPSGSTFAGGKKAKGKAKAREISEETGVEDVLVEGIDMEEEASESEDESEAVEDSFKAHFGPETPLLSPSIVSAAEDEWNTTRCSVRGLGRVVETRPRGVEKVEGKARLVPSVAAAVKKASPLAQSYLAHLGAYTDLYAHSLDGEADGRETAPFPPSGSREALRAASAAHALNHVLKTRKRIVKNNEKLAHAADAGTDIESPRDQSFTRPKVLLLLPLRSLALRWLRDHIFPLAGEGTQIENRRPFEASFGLPEDEADPLEAPDAAASFPIDHLENFRGNSDDNFRFGLKITRKAWRVVMPPANEAKLMDCDVLIASPLAIKMAAEKEDSTDLLSSIEILIADGTDVMEMQNWDHVQYVFSHLNEIPKSPHGCDFSRVKPWYLEGNARLLRQTLIFGRYDTPEARALLNKHCHNVAGKLRVDAARTFAGVLDKVTPGVRQVFERIDLAAPQGRAGMSGQAAAEEADARLEWFTKKTLPALLRSAVSRDHTLLVIPSYFDFVRVTAALRKSGTVTYAAISEYSSPSEISRARTLFFKGKRALLVVTERLHFYRRYRLRGAKTVVFYSLPAHAAFYAEFLATPFIANREAEARGQIIDDAVDPAEVSARVLFSRFDVLRLERVVGHEDARKMLASQEGRFEYI